MQMSDTSSTFHLPLTHLVFCPSAPDIHVQSHSSYSVQRKHGGSRCSTLLECEQFFIRLNLNLSHPVSSDEVVFV